MDFKRPTILTCYRPNSIIANTGNNKNVLKGSKIGISYRRNSVKSGSVGAGSTVLHKPHSLIISLRHISGTRIPREARSLPLLFSVISPPIAGLTFEAILRRINQQFVLATKDRVAHDGNKPVLLQLKGQMVYIRVSFNYI